MYFLFAVSDQIVNSQCNYFSKNADVNYSYCCIGFNSNHLF